MDAVGWSYPGPAHYEYHEKKIDRPDLPEARSKVHEVYTIQCQKSWQTAEKTG